MTTLRRTTWINRPTSLREYDASDSVFRSRAELFSDDSQTEHACSTQLTFPDHLEDGSYVMMWTGYGVHDSMSLCSHGILLTFV